MNFEKKKNARRRRLTKVKEICSTLTISILPLIAVRTTHLALLCLA